MYVRSVLAGLLVAAPLTAQTIRGTVFDSIANKPLVGAVVTAADTRDPAASARSATTDSAGAYAIPNLSAGTWLVGFLHPTLDSLGLEPVTRRIAIAGDMRVDLAVPGHTSMHNAFCANPTDSTGALIGHLRDASTGNAIDSGKVIAQWSVITFANKQLARSLPTYVVTTNAEGWFAFCGVPSQTTIAVQGVRGTDSSGSVMLEVPSRGIAHRELYTAKAELLSIAAAVDSTRADSVIVERVRRGTGRLEGIARDASSGKPLAGVQVTVEGTGLSTTAAADGTFTLANLPLGTQTLLTRRVGYVPDERPIDVLAGPATRVEPSLVTIKALLDTVRVVGKRVFNADRTGFGMRRKGSVGKFFGPDDIDKLRPIQTTDLFHRVLGVKMVTAGFDHVIRMRGTFKGDCTPNIFVDGFRYRDFNANDIDNMVHPDAVAGVEVYVSPTSVPSEYLSPFSNCGTILIWTKR